MQWSCDGQDVGSIMVSAQDGSVVLEYRHTHAGESEDVSYTVPLTYTSCHYGGRRPWFICPGAGCGRRVGKLFAAGKYFLCRHCYNIAYHSQNISEADRLLGKAQAIRKRLGASTCTWDPIVLKPKGMHWTTFNRLRAEAYAAGDRCNLIMASKIGRWV